MDKVYDPQKYERGIYRKWEESGAFSPKGKNPFTILMPPPNANDPLHIGHAMFVTIEDLLIRWKRMMGFSALWLPGTDHAGIETQYVFEKKLAKQGKSRFDFDRETLYKMIWDYVKENSDVAVNQMKRLGASADWSRKKFTLDPDVVDFVLETFIKLHKDGLVYRDMRLVNYCTKCGTAFSNLEIMHEERSEKLYFVNYQTAIVATTRPETIYADAALAVNPKDKKNKRLIGLTAVNPLTGDKLPIIADKDVNPDFGTGVLKITPAHDKTDETIAKRHKLAGEQVIGLDGRMRAKAKDVAGMKANQAREKVVEILKNKKLLARVNGNYKHSVGLCYKCATVIEPLPLPQFFIKTKPLAKKALAALSSNKVKIIGAGHDKILKHWLENLEDWNISRQIVWGIKIPVWYKKGSTEYVAAKKSPGNNFIQETDTFDTWFSSSQWPVVTLKTGKPGDFEKFYPTSVMETGYDILPFWVMRMLLMGLYLTEEVPFKTVYLHGLIRDERGQKMSKSKGNVIDPLTMVDKYGTDALRMALVIRSTPGLDKGVGENDIRAMRNFSNKIWNIARFVLSCAPKVRSFANFSEKSLRNPDDKWILGELNKVTGETTKSLEKYRFGMATEKLYDFVWHKFADVYIEKIKSRKQEAFPVLFHTLITCLKLLHPFVPFVTEAVWQEVREQRTENREQMEEMLIFASWPKSTYKFK